MSDDIRVVLADDDPQVRAALCDLIDSVPGLKVVGEAGSAAEAIAACRFHQPQLAVLDVRMPGGGESAAASITHEQLADRVIALSAHDDPQARQRMTDAGAATYIVKAAADDIVEVLLGGRVG